MAECGGIEAYAARPLRARVTECHFGFYSSDEIRALSVLNITSTETFDDLGNPIPGGLNDPKLGPTSRNEICPTCGLDDKECSGHMGHIELPLPTYHPLLMDHTYLLLRSQCAHCQRLRLSEPEKRAAAISLYLYKRGRWQEAEELASKLAACEADAKDEKDRQKKKVTLKKNSKSKAKAAQEAKKKKAAVASGEKEKAGLDFGSDDSSSSSDDSSSEESGDTEESDPTTEEEEEEEDPNRVDVHTILLGYEKRFGFQTGGEADAIEDTNKTKASSTAADKNETDIPLLSSFERSLRHQYIKSLLDTIIHTKKCGQCGGFSPTIRKDGYTKFFVKNLPRNYKNSNRRLGLSTFDEVPAITQATSTGTASALSLPPAIGAKSPTTAGSTSNKEDEAYMSEDEIDKRREMEDMKKKQEEQMEESAVSTKQKFLPPSEVEQRISSLWSFGVEGRMLEEIYGKMLHGDTIELQKKSTTTPVVPVSQTKQVQKPRGEGHETWRLFFVSVIAVPPPRFRPAAVIGGVTAENPQNVQLTKVMSIASKIRGMQGASAATSSNGGQLWKEGEDRLAALFSSWIDLQINVNGFMDASKASGGGGSSAQNDIPVFGIRQLLEKKQGLFRMNMMGKRVNHACRSVISPDLNVRAGEIGLPLRFAKALSWPENVSVHNVAALRVLVERGCDSYPGANWVRDAQGNMVNLERLPLNRRQGLAKRLLAGEGQTVGRHLVDGDMVIMNRQPTLHKPSMMAHQVRVFKYLPDSQQTIRMHYANCNSYNADFDGDEMNCHLPMSLLAKSESQHIVHNPHQYIVPTDGSPVRGLIQDHVDSAVKLSQKDCFLPKDLFLQLLSPAAHVLGCVLSSDLALHLPPPAILKPRQLYTGKQLFTTILSLLVQHNCPEAVTKHTITRTVEAGGAGVVKKGKSSKSSKSSPATASLKITKHIGLCMENKSKTPDWAYGASSLEHKPLWSNGYFARGILDKSAIGASGAGLIHSIFEMYGAHASSAMLDAIGRCLSLFLQYAGHSCGIADLVLKPDAEESRRALLQQSSKTAISAAAEFLKISNKENQLKAAAVGGASGGGSDSANSVENEADIRKGLGRLLSGTNEEEALAACAALDSEMQSSLNTTSSEVVKVCLPDGLKFPVWSPGPNSGGKHANGFALMVSTGAKGSKVNQSQVTVCLGQQALEGRRVPHMVSGKTLPSFRPWAHTTDARAGGFVSDRFLTGLRPQEYYFHCMGGREGLVDTAVKTSRSGYLQRCLVKGLEELTVAYDHSVRDSAGNVVQFQYGEDGLDVTRSYFLQSDEKTMAFLNSNLSTFNKTYNLEEEEEEKNNEEKNLKISALEAHSHVNKWKNQISKQMLSSRNTQKKSSGSASIELVKLNVGDVVQARRLKKDSKEKNGSSSWGRDQLQAGWYAATITNITTTGIPTSSPSKADKKAKKKEKASSLESGFVGKSAAASFLDVYSPEELLQVRADIRYDEDGSVEKNVPLVVNWKFSEAQKQQFANVESTQRYADVYSVPIVLSPGHDLLPHYAKIIPPVYGHHRHLQAHTPGVLSEKMNDTIINFEKVIQKKNPSFVSSNNEKKSSFRKMVEEKWCRSLAAPGEAVGCLAAQSVGEPSTQMTLNTFHLAGHGGANVTLGIPRLRELLMTASRSLKTPNMTIPLANAQPNDKSSKEFLAQQATAYSMSRQIQKLTLNEILSSDGGVVVKESVEPFIVSTQNTGGSGNHQHNISQYCRKYEITIKLQPPKLIKKAFGIKWKLLAKVLKTQFFKKLAKIVNMELKRGDKDVRLFLDDMSNGFESDEEDDVAQDGMNIEHSDLNDMLQEDAMNDSDNEEGVSSKVKARGGQAKKAGKKGGLGNKSSGGKQAAQMGESDSDGDSDSDEGGEEDGTLRVGKKLKEKKAYEEEESDSDSDSDDGDKAKKSRGALGGLIDDEAEEASGSDSDSDSDRHERKGASQKKREKEALKLKAKLASPSKSPSSKKGSMTEEMTSNCNMIETKDGIRFNLLAPARAGRVLMVSLAERAAEITVVKEMEGLSSAHVVERDIKVMKSYDEVEKQKRWALFTEGCNFHSIWSLEARVQFRTPNTPLFDLNRLKSNDVGAVLVVYGVEAARLNIMNEVRGVFDVYGIEVDQRHLSLIADTMTFGGGFRPFNRIGIGEATSSPFLQMSFETTAGFLTAAAVAGEPDRLTSPSARIVMGQIPKQGTGAFELRSTIA